MPARISGVTLPNKPAAIALTYIFGVGRTTAKNILETSKIDMQKRADDLTDEEVKKITAELDKMPHEGDLRRKVQNDMKRLQEIGCYRGYRHRRRLPSRGQRTRTNARTRKGKAVAIANKKM